MAAFYPTQPVRIVATFRHTVRFLIGREGYVVGPGENWSGVIGYLVCIPSAPSPLPSGRWFFAADQLEPIRYLPTPEDFVSLERVPPDVLREAVGSHA